MSAPRALSALRLVPSLLVATRVRSLAPTLKNSAPVLRSALEDVWEEVHATMESVHAEVVSRVSTVLLDHLSN